jgi:hypothetical protein
MKRNLHLAMAGVVWLFHSSGAATASGTMTAFNGHCLYFVGGGMNLTEHCSSALIVSEYTNGLSSFSFTATNRRGQVTIAFEGETKGTRINRPGGNPWMPIKAVLQITKHSTAQAPEPVRIAVTGGFCQQGMLMGGSAQIVCHITSADGPCTGIFEIPLAEIGKAKIIHIPQ